MKLFESKDEKNCKFNVRQLEKKTGYTIQEIVDRYNTGEIQIIDKNQTSIVSRYNMTLEKINKTKRFAIKTLIPVHVFKGALNSELNVFLDGNDTKFLTVGKEYDIHIEIKERLD